MRILPFVIFTVLLINPPCFAQESNPPVSPSASSSAEIKVFEGTVEKVEPPDIVNMMPAKVVASNEKGERFVFTVPSGVPVFRSDGKKIPVFKLKKNSTVVIEYILGPRKSKVAKSIKEAP